MIARLTEKNQLTIPDPLVFDLPHSEFYDITCENGRIILTPVSLETMKERSDEVRRKIEELGITEEDGADAVKWARSQAE